MDSYSSNRLPCAACWDLASERGIGSIVSRMTASAGAPLTGVTRQGTCATINGGPASPGLPENPLPVFFLSVGATPWAGRAGLTRCDANPVFARCPYRAAGGYYGYSAVARFLASSCGCRERPAKPATRKRTRCTSARWFYPRLLPPACCTSRDLGPSRCRRARPAQSV